MSLADTLQDAETSKRLYPGITMTSPGHLLTNHEETTNHLPLHTSTMGLLNTNAKSWRHNNYETRQLQDNKAVRPSRTTPQPCKQQRNQPIAMLAQANMNTKKTVKSFKPKHSYYRKNQKAVIDGCYHCGSRRHGIDDCTEVRTATGPPKPHPKPAIDAVRTGFMNGLNTLIHAMRKSASNTTNTDSTNKPTNQICISKVSAWSVQKHKAGPGYAIGDSGASDVLTDDRRLLSGFVHSCKVPIGGISGSHALMATAVGNGFLPLGNSSVPIRRMYFVPGLGRTLLSISALAREGLSTTFTGITPSNPVSTMVIKNDTTGNTLLTTPCSNGLYTYSMKDDFTQPSKAIFQSDIKNSPIHETRGYLAAYNGTITNTYVGDTPIDQLIHNRIGHISYGNRNLANRLRRIFGASLGKNHKICACAACMKSKMAQTFNRQPTTRPATKPLGRLHYDYKPVPCNNTIGGYCGFLLIVDEATKNCWVFPVKSKSEVCGILVHFITHAEAFFKTKTLALSCPHELAALRSDGGSENIPEQFQTWCKSKGAVHEVSAPYCQWQNGIAERFVRTVWSGAEAMRKHSGAPPRFWPYSVQAFAYTWSHLALGDSDKSPTETWTNTNIPLSQSLAYLRTFGCKCWIDGSPAIFVGYSDITNAYLAVDIATGAVITRTDIAFDETNFPFKTLEANGTVDPNSRTYEALMQSFDKQTPAPPYPQPPPPTALLPSPLEQLPPILDLNLDLGATRDPGQPEGYRVASILGHKVHHSHTPGLKEILFKVRWTGYHEETWEPASSFSIDADHGKFSSYCTANQNSIQAQRDQFPGQVMDFNTAPQADQPETTHTPHHPTSIDQPDPLFDLPPLEAPDPTPPTPQAHVPPNQTKPPQRRSSRIATNLPSTPPANTPTTAAAPTQDQPQTPPDTPPDTNPVQLRRSTRIAEAKPDTVPDLQATLAFKFEAADARRKSTHHPCDPNGAPYPHPTGPDTHQRYRLSTILSTASTITKQDMGQLRQQINAMAASTDQPGPPSFKLHPRPPWTPSPSLRTFRALMAEASGNPTLQTRGWNLSIPTPQPRDLSVARLALQPLGFTNSRADPNLFILTASKDFVRILFHANTALVTFNSVPLYDVVFKSTRTSLGARDPTGSSISTFLGIEVTTSPDSTITLHQTKYLDELFTLLRITGANQSPAAAGSHKRLRPTTEPNSAYDSRLLADFDYDGAVEALYAVASSTRPDITHAVSQVDRFKGRPGPLHLAALLRIYRYLLRTRSTGLRLSANSLPLSSLQCVAFSDADWTGCTETAKSTTGYIIRLRGSTVDWSTTRQITIAQSSCEAEYTAAAETANQVTWWRLLLTELTKTSQLAPTRLYCDNKAATVLARHSGRWQATKHISPLTHKLRHHQEAGTVDVTWLSATNMLADILTKNSEPKLFRRLSTIIMGSPV